MEDRWKPDETVAKKQVVSWVVQWAWAKEVAVGTEVSNTVGCIPKLLKWSEQDDCA